MGDACFYIEKVLDRIYELDSNCSAEIERCRKQLWPDYHEGEAKRDEELEKKEAEEKKRKARERQRKMMEDLKKQRERFMKQQQGDISMDEDEVEVNQEEETKNVEEVEKEYTCCHCLMQSPASEERPIGLVTLIQSSSVLAHRHHKTCHLNLPTSDEEEETLRSAFEDSLGSELQARFEDLHSIFGQKAVLLAMNRSWRGGIHIQSCGHHMHYDCR